MALRGTYRMSILIAVAVVTAWPLMVAAQETPDVETMIPWDQLGIEPIAINELMAESDGTDQLIIPLYQQRILELDDPGCIPGDPPLLIQVAAEDMNVWSESLFVDVHECPEHDPLPVRVAADHQSSIGGQSLFTATAVQIDHIPGFIGWYENLHAKSRFFVRFVVPERLKYEISGLLEVKIEENLCDDLWLTGWSSITLTRVAGSTVQAEEVYISGGCTNTIETLPLNIGGVLDVGVYELDVTTEVTTACVWNSGVEIGSAEGVHIVALEFTPEETLIDEADLDHDGDVDLADYALFIEALTGPK